MYVVTYEGSGYTPHTAFHVRSGSWQAMSVGSGWRLIFLAAFSITLFNLCWLI